jgi:osmotically-inducible protein OsmY
MAHDQKLERPLAGRFSDSELQERAIDALRADSRVDVLEIDVGTADGRVFLHGMVDSAAERRAALEAVATVVDPGAIEDRLSLRNYVERTDEQLGAAVRQAMIRDTALDARSARVRAKNGVVILEGRAINHAQRTALENIAWWTPGVTDVIDQMQVEDVSEPPDEPDY